MSLNRVIPMFMHNMVKMKGVMICTLLMHSQLLFAQNGNIDLSLNMQIAKSITSEICSGKMEKEVLIRESVYVRDMLTHFSQFRDYFTIDNYLVARRNASKCVESKPDYFRFNALVRDKKPLIQDIEMLDDMDSSLIQSIISPYVPNNVEFSGQAVVAVGTPSCGGWSINQRFYVDLPCIEGDMNGLLYLSAHETYHVVQDTFMPIPDAKHYLPRLLSDVIREGAATAIADFNQLPAGGKYTDLSQKDLQTNSRRLKQNFQLLDLAIGYLQTYNTERGYSAINNIGLSGSYGSPFYSVGATVFSTIERKLGKDKLLCLLQRPAIEIFATYNDLAAQDPSLTDFGPATLEILKSNSSPCVASH